MHHIKLPSKSHHLHQLQETTLINLKVEPTSKPPPIFFNTPRKQYLRAKGWTPPSEHDRISSPSTFETPYSAHPAYVSNMGWKSQHPRSPAVLFNVRILQVVLAIVYLVLLSYSGVHHGWWYHLEKPLGFGSTFFQCHTLSIALPRVFPTRPMLSLSHHAHLPA